MRRYQIYLFNLLLLIITVNKVSAINNPHNQNDVNICGILYIFPHTYEGSPYLFDTWSIGTVYLENGEQVDNLRLKYNRLSGQLIFYHEKYKKLFVVDTLILHSFTLNNGLSDSLFFTKYEGEELGFRLSKGDFLNLLYDGKMKFMVKRTATISLAKEIDEYNKIEPKNLYFLKNGNKTDEIKLNKRSLMKLFPNKRQEIKKIARQNHFSRKSEIGMLKLISALDEL